MAGWTSGLAGTNKRTNRKSPHSIGLPPLSGLLPKKEKGEEEEGEEENQLPKGIKWSVVPLPCSTFSLVFMGAGRAVAPIGDKVL